MLEEGVSLGLMMAARVGVEGAVTVDVIAPRLPPFSFTTLSLFTNFNDFHQKTRPFSDNSTFHQLYNAATVNVVVFT